MVLQLIIERYPTGAIADDARGRLAVLRGRPDVDRSGAVELLTWSTLYGLWLGVAVPGALEVNDPEPYGAGLLVGGPGGFLVARSLLRERPISVGQARAITWGGTWGTWQGFGWADVLGLNVDSRENTYEICIDFNPSTGECRSTQVVTEQSEEYDSGRVFTSFIAGGAIGLAAGSLIAGRGDISPGTATLVSSGSLWGTWYGAALSLIADQDEHEDAVLLWSLVGGNVGLLTTALIAPGYEVSRARARIINVAGLVGLLGGFS
jgi:hypothetical protein